MVRHVWHCFILYRLWRKIHLIRQIWHMPSCNGGFANKTPLCVFNATNLTQTWHKPLCEHSVKALICKVIISYKVFQGCQVLAIGSHKAFDPVVANMGQGVNKEMHILSLSLVKATHVLQKLAPGLKCQRIVKVSKETRVFENFPFQNRSHLVRTKAGQCLVTAKVIID